tara:strand:+ start:15250 stop:15765 length:516 start_codon:yes stop_codon:yes gene_type:complete
MERKKGIQLNQAFGAVLTLVLVAVLVIIAIVIFVSLNTSFAGTSSLAAINESVTIVAGGVAVSDASLCSSGNFVVSEATNATGPSMVQGQDYAIGSTTGILTNLTMNYSSGDWNVSYTGTWGSEACTASDNMTTEFGSYTSLIGLVGTIIFLGLVIGILVTAFAFGGRREV